MKICSKCNELKPLSEYHKDKYAPDGLVRICKACKRISDAKQYKRDVNSERLKSREYYNDNKDIITAKARQKYADNPDAELARKADYRERNPNQSREYYEKNKHWINPKKKAYNEEHKDEISIQKSEYYIKNKNHIDKRNKEYAVKNPNITNGIAQRYRHKKKSLKADLTLLQWENCLMFFDNKCAYCGKAEKTLTREHVIPVSSNGEYTVDNIIPACGSCNSKKHNKDMVSWYINMPFYSSDRLEKINDYLKINSKELLCNRQKQKLAS